MKLWLIKGFCLLPPPVKPPPVSVNKVQMQKMFGFCCHYYTLLKICSGVSLTGFQFLIYKLDRKPVHRYIFRHPIISVHKLFKNKYMAKDQTCLRIINLLLCMDLLEISWLYRYTLDTYL